MEPVEPENEVFRAQQSPEVGEKVVQSAIGRPYFQHSHFRSSTKLPECQQDGRSFHSQRCCFEFLFTPKRWKRAFRTSRQNKTHLSSKMESFSKRKLVFRMFNQNFEKHFVAFLGWGFSSFLCLKTPSSVCKHSSSTGKTRLSASTNVGKTYRITIIVSWYSI